MFKDFEIKKGGHRESLGGHFFWVPPFDRGFGGDPLIFSKIFFYQKLLINIIKKSQEQAGAELCQAQLSWLASFTSESSYLLTLDCLIVKLLTA